MDLIPRRFFLDDFKPEFRTTHMKCDIYEKDNKYFIEIDVPGFKKEDISLDCDNGYLTVTASKEANTVDEDKNYIRKERSYGKYQRQFYIGNVDEENIKAEFADGILKVVVPKKEVIDTKRKIEIE